MKKILMGLFTVIVCSSAANAQTERGDVMVGGNMTINTTSDNSTFTLQPSAGYFFARNFVAGANVALNFGKQGDVKTNAISAGPFTRLYFGPDGAVFKPFLHAELNLGNLNSTSAGVKSSNTFSNFFLGAGGAFFINNNVALEALAGFNRAKTQGLSTENGFLFRLGFQIHLLGREVERVRRR